MFLIDPSSEALHVVAAAVTPVVMVSATAILLNGVNSRYISLADRARGLTREYRDERTSAARRASIEKQIGYFRRRLHWAAWATRSLYAAVGCFIAMALLISAGKWSAPLQIFALPVFLAGLTLTAVAIGFQLRELHDSNQTIDLEMNSVLDPHEADEPESGHLPD